MVNVQSAIWWICSRLGPLRTFRYHQRPSGTIRECAVWKCAVLKTCSLERCSQLNKVWWTCSRLCGERAVGYVVFTKNRVYLLTHLWDFLSWSELSRVERERWVGAWQKPISECLSVAAPIWQGDKTCEAVRRKGTFCVYIFDSSID